MNKTIWILIVVALIVGAAYSILSNRETEPFLQSFTVEIKNISDSQPLAPGVYAIHTADFSLDYEGELAPESFEPMAEIGVNQKLEEFIGNQPGVLAVFTQKAPIPPGESASFTIEVETGKRIFLSGVQMAVASNDGYALANKLSLRKLPSTQVAKNYDNGTEENTDLGSGFSGGQPVPSRGAANVENGTATEPVSVVKKHPQLTFPIMEVVVR